LCIECRSLLLDGFARVSRQVFKRQEYSYQEHNTVQEAATPHGYSLEE
jgi:hypothetical protein